MPRVYLTRRRGALFDERRPWCPICIANRTMGLTKRRGWFGLAQAYHHPNPLRPNVTIWRCRRHTRLQFVPLEEKQGLGGGVYR